jgi:uncharacterized protein (TIGR04551 family)
MRVAATAAALCALWAAPAWATGFTDIGQDLIRRDGAYFHLEGNLRLRGEWLHNLDLDRGPTPSGELFFPVPLGDARAQALTHADMRLRSDLALYAPGGGAAVKVRLDALDNLSLGSTPNADPASSTGQVSPRDAIRVKRAYGEVLTPVGLLVAGRTGSTWGLGMLANGGDCADCDSGDAADRVAFLTPTLGHIWALAYDLSASGPLVLRRHGDRAIDLDPDDDVRAVTFAVLNWRDDAARARHRASDRWLFEYGAYVAHQWQDRDVPAAYVPTTDGDGALGRAQVIDRGYRATALDGWLRLTTPSLRVEVEAAFLTATVDQVSLLPGVTLPDPATSTQFGAALESLWIPGPAWLSTGLDAGIASGDDAPGFGAFEGVNAPAPLPGDLDGPQASPPRDNTADNFRFHRDYRVDRILFREIIGTVTDALYLRPHLPLQTRDLGAGTLTLSLAAILSRALEPSSAPGQEPWLGLELDPTLTWQSRDGFTLALEHALLIPMSGLDNPAQGLQAQPAQLLRLRAMVQF